jgi:hypothetical protein
VKATSVFFVIVYGALGIFIPTSLAQTFSSDPRQNVVDVAFYALDTTHDGTCGQTTNDGKCLSNWNFLNDPNYSSDFQTVVGWYNKLSGYTQTSRTCLASDWMTDAEYQSWHSSNPNDTCLQIFTPSLYSHVADYGFSTAGGSYGNVGRGGQCRFFANLVYYRAMAMPPSSVFPDYSDMWGTNGVNVQTDLTQAIPGDILTANPNQTFRHTAIVIAVTVDGSGNPALDIIDSNWVPDITGEENREVIARHTITIGTYQGILAIWMGVSYYSDPWLYPPTGLTAVVQ